VKFLVLMAEEDHYARWDALDDAARDEMFAGFDAFARAVEERGSVLAGDALAAPAEARTVRPGDDRPVVAGPYAETVEQVGGFFLIEVPDLEAAVELARRLPRNITAEVRPVLDMEPR
jgi:hypothetical protein